MSDVTFPRSNLDLPEGFDFKNPDYAAIFNTRVESLRRLRESPEKIALLRSYYKDNPAQFINDWGMTFDPRNLERGLPAFLPFIPFPRQHDLIDWIVGHWREGTPGLVEKSRDTGVSWVAISLSCTLCIHFEGMAIGFGSRKEEYVDRIGAPKSLFEKGRGFMGGIPPEFRGSWSAAKHSPHMRINFPDTESNISGEAGDNIGRGDRTGIYFVDESAHLERPQLIEQSLSATTNCRIDMSSVNGRLNPFAEKRHGGKIDVFIFDWKDDPRKDEKWYAKQEFELDPITLAQEVNRDYAGSVESLIPHEWVEAAVDAHIRLGIKPTGARLAALDVADEGKDSCAWLGSYGILVDWLEEWSGKGGDIYNSVVKSFGYCDEYEAAELRFDSDGLGAGVRGDARTINEERKKVGRPQLSVVPFRGSEAVSAPTQPIYKGSNLTNEDFFKNCKSQSWWNLRTRFQKTFRTVKGIETYPADDLISIRSDMPLRRKLVSEISQVTYSLDNAGKVVIDKAPEGTKSPNLADACMMRYAPRGKTPMRISAEALARA